MLWRILAWLVILAAAWWLFRPREPRVPHAARAKPPGGARALGPPEAMVDCARCGVHHPASETLRDGAGRAYCCAEHRIAGPRAQA